MKSFKSSSLYYFSGTGNTFRVARWIEASLQSKGLATRLKAINELGPQADHDQSTSLTILLFPTHGFMPPWSMIKFLLRLPRRPKGQALVVATRGALWLVPLKIPGAAGLATFFAALVLFLKGYDLRGFCSVDMASNLTNFHSALSDDAIKRISQKSLHKIPHFLQPILSGRRLLFTLNNFYEGIWAVLLLWFIPIYPILYLIYGKTSMAKMMFAGNSCISCGRCSRICPNQAIEMRSFFGKKKPYWTYGCENCMRCMAYCPRQAVHAGHSLAVMQYTFITSIVLAKFVPWFASSTGLWLEVNNYWLQVLAESLIYVPALFVSYWMVWMMGRIQQVNTFLSLTSLNHYFRPYHEPGTGLDDLMAARVTDIKAPAMDIKKSS